MTLLVSAEATQCHWVAPPVFGGRSSLTTLARTDDGLIRRSTLMSARLVDTGPIIYAVPGQQLVQRNCRTWVTEDGRTVSVVTELPTDTGMSITNAAEEVRAVLEATWGGGSLSTTHGPAMGTTTSRFVRQPAFNGAGSVPMRSGLNSAQSWR